MEPFVIINVATVIAVVVGGLTMGIYLAMATKCGYTPSLTTLIVLGWSFLIPLGITQIFITNGDIGVDSQRVVERLALWALFSIHARYGAHLWSEFKRKGLRSK
jgi:hypothetical protein